jgi:hypothetical protein
MRYAWFALVFGSSFLIAAEPLKPGLTVGQRPGPYSFLVATGPERGQQTCFVCAQDTKPTVIVFARTLTPQLGALLSQLDAETPRRKDSGYKAWMTLLAEEANLDELGKWAQRQGLKTLPIGTFEDTDGPPAYKIPQAAEVVLLIAKDKKVLASFAYRTGELTEKAQQEALKSVQTLFSK